MNPSDSGRLWPAQYYTSESAPPRQVLVRIGSSGLEFDRTLWRYPEIVQTRGAFAGEPARLDRGPELLVIPDRRFLAVTQRYAPHLRQLEPDRQPHLALALLIGGPALALLLIAAIVVFFDKLADLMPQSWEERLGQSAVEQMAPEVARCSDPGLRDSIAAVVARIEPRSPYRFRVYVVNDPAVNALAAPGGHIILYRGLLQLAASPEELAGILAHEMQHVLLRHSTRGLFRSLGLTSAIALLFGDITGIAGAAGKLGDLSFQRGDELEADRNGMRTLREARVDTAAMISVYRKLEQAGSQTPGVLKYLSTHPATEDRIRALEREPQTESPNPLRVEGWDRAIRSCP